MGCNIAFGSTVFDRIGEFDEALDTGPPLAGGGDLDILIRIARSGGTIVYEPSALVRHEHRREESGLRAQYVSWGKSWGAVLAKWLWASRADRWHVERAVLRALRGFVRDLLRRSDAVAHGRRDSARMLAGFLMGTLGEHGRSQRRMARRRSEAQQVT